MESILFDLDGVICQGDQPIVGASETLDWVRSQDIPHLFLTNTTSRPRSAIADKVRRMGIPVDPDSILTPPVAALQHATGIEPVVLGKPAEPFFVAALAALDAAPRDTLMIGDDIRGDIGGAQGVGIRAVLVRTGKFRAQDLHGNIKPDGVIDAIAGLPD